MVEVFNKTLSDSDEKIRYERYQNDENPLKKRNDEYDEKFSSSNHPFIRDNFDEDDEDHDRDYPYLATDPLNSSLNNNKSGIDGTSLRKRGSRGEGRSSSSSSYQNVSIHDGINVTPTNDKLNAENNPNPYQGMSIDREEPNEFVDDPRGYSVVPDHEEDEDSLYKNKYRSSKYQYKMKHPISSTFSNSDPSRRASSLYRSGSLDEMRDRTSKNRESIAFKRISNSVQNIDMNQILGAENTQRLDSMKKRLSQKVPRSKLRLMNRTIKSKFNKNVIYNILKRLQIVMSEIQKYDYIFNYYFYFNKN